MKEATNPLDNIAVSTGSVGLTLNPLLFSTIPTLDTTVAKRQESGPVHANICNICGYSPVKAEVVISDHFWLCPKCLKKLRRLLK